MIQVNGKEVHSDKSVSSIIGTRVEFADGSWCDVNTGQVVNKGAGYINIGAPSADSSGPAFTRGPESFRPQSLEVRDVNADVNVEIYQEASIKVTIVGPEKVVKKIRVSEQGGRLMVQGSDERGGGDNIVISGGRGNVVIGGSVRGVTIVSGQSIVIGGGGGNTDNEVKITVQMPKGYAVNLDGVAGKAVVGDIEADLAVTAKGLSSVRAGRVAAANVNLKGQGHVNIAQTNGNVSAQISGQGEVGIDGGNMLSVMAGVSGQGSINIGGSAQNAMLTVSGQGNVYVQHVENRPMINKSGQGSVRVGNW